MPNAAGAISQRLNPSLATIRSFDKIPLILIPNCSQLIYSGYFSWILIVQWHKQARI
jgi:hypothetical protein